MPNNDEIHIDISNTLTLPPNLYPSSTHRRSSASSSINNGRVQANAASTSVNWARQAADPRSSYLQQMPAYLYGAVVFAVVGAAGGAALGGTGGAIAGGVTKMQGGLALTNALQGGLSGGLFAVTTILGREAGEWVRARVPGEVCGAAAGVATSVLVGGATGALVGYVNSNWTVPIGEYLDESKAEAALAQEYKMERPPEETWPELKSKFDTAKASYQQAHDNYQAINDAAIAAGTYTSSCGYVPSTDPFTGISSSKQVCQTSVHLRPSDELRISIALQKADKAYAEYQQAQSDYAPVARLVEKQQDCARTVENWSSLLQIYGTVNAIAGGTIGGVLPLFYDPRVVGRKGMERIANYLDSKKNEVQATQQHTRPLPQNPFRTREQSIRSPASLGINL